MRFVIYGAGAIGGVLGGRLYEHGHDVVLVARGRHFEAISDHGLRLESPDGSSLLDIPAVRDPGELEFRTGDVVLLTVKSQHSAAALRTLATCLSNPVPVVCVQNGVENERQALRLFSDVYGVSVMCPAAHLDAGVVHSFSAPITGILDVGRCPAGEDDLAERITEAFRASAFASEVRPDIMRWKYRKLLTNLGNALEAVCGPDARHGPAAKAVAREGEDCLRAAGIDFASADEDTARRNGLITMRPIAGLVRPGGSSWQSLKRGTGTIETDFLNGEVVLLGRLVGVPTPANRTLQLLADGMAQRRMPPGAVSQEDFLSRVSRVASQSASDKSFR